MSVKGMAQLAAMRKAFSKESIAAVRLELHKAAAAEALTQVQLGFKASKDPNWQDWAPLKQRDGMPLRDTGRMANSFTSRPTLRGFEIGTNTEYAKFHQYGTNGLSRPKTVNMALDPSGNGRFMSYRKAGNLKRKFVFFRPVTFPIGSGKIPIRRMVPEGELSPRWDTAIQKSVERAFRREFAKLKGSV